MLSAKTCTGVLLLLVIAVGNIFADETQEHFSRKSISFIDNPVVVGSHIQLKQADLDELASAIHKEIRMPRFDYNPLPDTLVSGFSRRMKDAGTGEWEQITRIIQETLVETIVTTLKTEQEMRAADLLTETDQMSFISRKAKQLGITADDLRSVMNSAYIYLPVIMDVERSVS